MKNWTQRLYLHRRRSGVPRFPRRRALHLPQIDPTRFRRRTFVRLQIGRSFRFDHRRLNLEGSYPRRAQPARPHYLLRLDRTANNFHVTLNKGFSLRPFRTWSAGQCAGHKNRRRTAAVELLVSQSWQVLLEMIKSWIQRTRRRRLSRFPEARPRSKRGRRLFLRLFRRWRRRLARRLRPRPLLVKIAIENPHIGPDWKEALKSLTSFIKEFRLLRRTRFQVKAQRAWDHLRNSPRRKWVDTPRGRIPSRRFEVPPLKYLPRRPRIKFIYEFRYHRPHNGMRTKHRPR